ncbi:exopolysaccharide biosynthesis polyprenyl glycosylphosphotransferase [Halanaeroarchaeum sulfurireducens]|uniref:Exopolysaccharide biosynthesis polyprenyl glycosylphosphotransferase n=1 Tax=Halanaeroarchaeum sulfurireducens TaxID=1604004 RepID=A0A0N9MW86_9EURY|nr:exopolysaccharide biosynthesis polyprenyl glycosylphosphotransferase [Halanaeroarchaeum sulfurireducens]
MAYVMASGWRYRSVSALGTLLITAIALTLANLPAVQGVVTTRLPVIAKLSAATLSNGQLVLVYLTSVLVLLGAMAPLFKPRPRRILDTVLAVQKRVLTGLLALAAIGYFDYSYRLPRSTLIIMGAVVLVALPAFFVAIRLNPEENGPTIIVGDDPAAMANLHAEMDEKPIGYVSPPLENGLAKTDGSGMAVSKPTQTPQISKELPRLGGLTKLDDVLVEYDVDTALLGFSTSDRADFFGALDECYEHGVAAKVHRDHVDNVLADSDASGPIVDVELEPLDAQDYLLKRTFDLAFSLFGLLMLAPVSLAILIAIKLDDGGPIFYEQERTAEFGQSFTIYKFRTMTPEGESPVPTSDDSNDRITRVGRIIGSTHFDEIPQLVSILTGTMSVVGPRAVWREEETILQDETDQWRRRWFVKPGLTGLAQIESVTSEDPAEKLRLDLAYIRQQSFWFDVKIVIRQLWMVVGDVVGTIVAPESEPSDDE